MNTDFELLSRYIDGELDAEEKREIEGRIEQEPELSDMYLSLRELNDRYILEVSEIDKLPLSASLAASLADDSRAKTPSVVKLCSEVIRSISDYFSWRNGLAWATACSLVLAVLFSLRFGGTDFEISDTMLAQGNYTPKQLGYFLSHKLTGSTEDFEDGSVSQKMAFLDSAGNVCKYYIASNSINLYHVVACHEGSKWQNQFVLKDEKQLASNDGQLFVPAKDELDIAVEKYLTKKITSTPLTKEEEIFQLEKIQ